MGKRLTLILGGARSGKSDFAQRLARKRGGAAVLFVATSEAHDAEMGARIDAHRAARPAQWATLEAPREVGRVLQSAPPARVVLLDCVTLWVSNVLLAVASVRSQAFAAGTGPVLAKPRKANACDRSPVSGSGKTLEGERLRVASVRRSPVSGSGKTLEGERLREAHLAEQAMLREVEELLAWHRGASCDLIVVSNEVGLGLVPADELGRAYRDLLGKVNQKLAETADEVFWLVAGLPIEVKSHAARWEDL